MKAIRKNQIDENKEKEGIYVHLGNLYSAGHILDFSGMQ